MLGKIPAGFVYIGTGPLARKYPRPGHDDLAIWCPVVDAWRLVDYQGSARCHYAARDGTEVHLLNSTNEEIQP